MTLWWTLHPSFNATLVKKLAELTIALFYPPRFITLILIILLQNLLDQHHYRGIPDINLSTTTFLFNLVWHHPYQHHLTHGIVNVILFVTNQ